jgi:AraC-like DNA-binding protein
VNTTDPIMGVAFENPRFPSLGVEALTLSDLLGRVPPQHFLRPQRPGFHVLLLFSAGRGWHSLDFAAIRCGPGTAIHIRPGQVQQFDPTRGLQASVLLFRPEFVLPEPQGTDATLLEEVLPEGSLELLRHDLEAVSDGFASLSREYARTDGSHHAGKVLQHMLHALLVRMAYVARGRNVCASTPPTYRRTYRRFTRSIECNLARHWKVGDYARELGVSGKTLGRACLAVGGLPPAKVIEGRVLLEAKRLLAHTELPAASIAGELGFDEPTNFVKFFRRLSGTTPIVFRIRLGKPSPKPDGAP